jgi:hypothetical protein
MRQRSDTLTLISLYHFACGVGNLLVMCAILLLPLVVGLAAASDSSGDGATATAIVAAMGLFGAAIFFALAVANFAAGWGLWQHRQWGRLAAIVLGIIRLINFPLGTVVGGLIIWYLFREEGKGEFAAAV